MFHSTSKLLYSIAAILILLIVTLGTLNDDRSLFRFAQAADECDKCGPTRVS